MTVNPKVYESVRQEIISFVIEQSPEKDTIGMCIIATSELVKRYPEFQVKSGRIIDYFEHSWNHYWCELPNSDIVDPTVDQFCPPVQYPNGAIWDYPPEHIKFIEVTEKHKM